MERKCSVLKGIKKWFHFPYSILMLYLWVYSYEHYFFLVYLYEYYFLCTVFVAREITFNGKIWQENRYMQLKLYNQSKNGEKASKTHQSFVIL